MSKSLRDNVFGKLRRKQFRGTAFYFTAIVYDMKKNQKDSETIKRMFSESFSNHGWAQSSWSKASTEEEHRRLIRSLRTLVIATLLEQNATRSSSLLEASFRVGVGTRHRSSPYFAADDCILPSGRRLQTEKEGSHFVLLHFFTTPPLFSFSSVLPLPGFSGVKDGWIR